MRYYIKLWWQSFTDKTPNVFMHIFKLMAGLSGLATVLLAIKDNLPQPIQDIPGYLLAASATAAFFAKSISSCPKTQAGIIKTDQNDK